MGSIKQEISNMMNGSASVIDMSISDRAIKDARKMFCKMLGERLLVAMVDTTTDPKTLNDRAWLLAEMYYDEMIRRESASGTVSISERMAAQEMGRQFRESA